MYNVFVHIIQHSINDPTKAESIKCIQYIRLTEALQMYFFLYKGCLRETSRTKQ
jgi:hypothetical protein